MAIPIMNAHTSFYATGTMSSARKKISPAVASAARKLR